LLARVTSKLGVAPYPQSEPYYQPPDGGADAPAAPAGPIFGAPIAPEQLPPGAVIAPGAPVPIETLPMPK